MIASRFCSGSVFDVVESFHTVKQHTTVEAYIEQFEEVVASVVRQYPGLTEPYFLESFIAGLKPAIKHYLKPHKPNSLAEAYWRAKDLEKGALAKMLLPSPTYQFPKPAYNPSTGNKPNIPLFLPPQPQTLQMLNQPL